MPFFTRWDRRLRDELDAGARDALYGPTPRPGRTYRVDRWPSVGDMSLSVWGRRRCVRLWRALSSVAWALRVGLGA